MFGCGGNRDATKRPLMGAIAARLADRVVVTSDNPRDEPPDPSSRRSSPASSATTTRRRDRGPRATRSRQAIADADARDVVLIAGKGHEDYQEIAGVRHPFSDVAEAGAALRAAGGAAR